MLFVINTCVPDTEFRLFTFCLSIPVLLSAAISEFVYLRRSVSQASNISKTMSGISTIHKKYKNYLQQECIPVGCVSSAAVVVSAGGFVSVHAGIPTPPDQALPGSRPLRDQAPPPPDIYCVSNGTYNT